MQGRRQQMFPMTKVCSHGGGKMVAMRQLEESSRLTSRSHSREIPSCHNVSKRGISTITEETTIWLT